MPAAGCSSKGLRQTLPQLFQEMKLIALILFCEGALSQLGRLDDRATLRPHRASLPPAQNTSSFVVCSNTTCAELTGIEGGDGLLGIALRDRRARRGQEKI